MTDFLTVDPRVEDVPEGSIPSDLYPVRNVRTHGATGDGIADDTTAIQTALNATTFSTVYFPPGKYLITRTLTWDPTRVQVQGVSATILCQIPQVSTVSQFAAKIATTASSSTASTRTAFNSGIQFLGVNSTCNGILIEGTTARPIAGLTLSNMTFELFNVAARVGQHVDSIGFRDSIFSYNENAVVFADAPAGALRRARFDGSDVIAGERFLNPQLTIGTGWDTQLTNCSLDWISRLISVATRARATFTACHFETPGNTMLGQHAQRLKDNPQLSTIEDAYGYLAPGSVLTISNSLFFVNYYEASDTPGAPTRNPIGSFFAGEPAGTTGELATLNFHSTYLAVEGAASLATGRVRVNVSRSTGWSTSPNIPMLGPDNTHNRLEHGSYAGELTVAEQTAVSNTWSHTNGGTGSGTLVMADSAAGRDRNAIAYSSPSAHLTLTAPLTGAPTIIGARFVVRSRWGQAVISSVSMEILDDADRVIAVFPSVVSSTGTPETVVGSAAWQDAQYVQVTSGTMHNPALARSVQFHLKVGPDSTLYVGEAYVNAY